MYDFSKTPIAAGMIARQHHVRNPLVLPGQDTAPVIRISYSDALGRIIMHKAQCEPVTLPGETEARQWVGSGRTIYNNKGSVVMQFEPYFSKDHQCDDAAEATAGVSPKMFYDPLNRVYRTELPDGTFTKTEWTAWQQKIWDNNDTVMDSSWYTLRAGGAMGPEEQEAAVRAAKHNDTPTLMHTDSLARPFYTLQHNRYPDLNDVQVDELIHSYVNLDIQGNRLSVVDGKSTHTDPADDTFCLQYRYHMLQGPGYQLSIDSGLQRTLTDIAGQPLYAWDATDQRFRMSYDTLRRLSGKYAGSQQFEKMVYGESHPGGNPKALNLRGALYEAFDTSGKQKLPNGYDFKGNPVKTEQQLLANKILTEVDWENAPPLLDPETFTTTALLDALNRPVRTTDPGDNIQEYVYDKGGALKQVKLNGTAYVNNILYDAKGQRQAIYYGNNTVTWYTYDPLTYRLRRLLTTANTGSETRKDLYYFYDPVGNITRIKDDLQDYVFYQNTRVSPHQVYTYDALYRLVIATGREHISNTAFNSKDNYNDSAMMLAPAPLQWDINALQTYTQRFRYDAVGNIQELKHSAGSGGYTRIYNYNNGNNRLSNTKIGTNPAFTDFTYDVRGNMTQMPHLSVMDWNSLNELAGIANSDLQAWYQYSGGQRIRKYVDKGSVFEERIYLGNFEIYRKFDASGSLKLIERTTVHISDDTGRIAMREVLNPDYGSDGSEAELTRYIYSNHLQSATLELDEAAEVISYEEYHPYGTTAYQAYSSAINATAKRYRYTGKERDEESGLYYHGARYYIPWLCRWCACDPINSENYNLAKGYGLGKNRDRDFLELCASGYEYAYDNPIEFTDATGEQPNKNKKGFLVPPPIPPPPTKIGVKAVNELSKKLVETAEKQAIKKIEKDIASKVLGRLLKIGGTTLGTALLVLTPSDMVQGAGELPDYMKPKQYTPDESGAPFTSKEEKDKYLEAQRITTDVNKLTEQDKNAIIDRINKGKATEQDLLYASKLDLIKKGELDMGEGRIFQHFTSKEGIIGITGISQSTIENLQVGEEFIVTKLKFGVGKNEFMAGSKGDIFVTDLPSSISEGKLNQIGVFGDRQNFVISFSEGSAFHQDVRVKGANVDRGIYTIPGNTELNGIFTIKRLK